MKRRQYFNMIEILLAVAIIAVGISSVMVLFTSGLRTGNDAVVSSDFPNAAESLLATVRRQALQYAESNGWNASIDSASVYPAVPSTGWPALSETSLKIELSDFGNIAASDESVISSSTGSKLLYRQLVASKVNKDGTVAEYDAPFSAVAEVRRVQSPADILISNPWFPLQNLDTKDGASPKFKDADNQDSQNRCRRVLEVRISYPAHLPAASREYKIYRLELYNHKYDRLNP